MRLNKVIYRVTSSDIHISERRFNCCSPIFARSERQLSNIHISERQFYCCSPIFAISERLCPIFAISERLCPILTGKLKTEKQNNVQYSQDAKDFVQYSLGNERQKHRDTSPSCTNLTFRWSF